MGNGMKSGAGDDPFADAEEPADDGSNGPAVDGSDASADDGSVASVDDGSDGSGTDSFRRIDDSDGNDGVSNSQPSSSPDTETPHGSTADDGAARSLPRVPDHPADAESPLPWIHRRDGVKDGRTPKTIHYTEHTVKRERREFTADVEDLLGEEPELTDLREAAYLIGMEHADEVTALLREWGYAIE